MSIYKAYDIRGIYGKDLTEKDSYMIGYYLAKHLNLEEIKIAHDMRLSYANLAKYLIQGILEANCKIHYLGKSSTPNFYFSLFHDTNTGIMITASHNPKEYNGFKIMHKGISFDSTNGLKDIEKLVIEDEDNKLNDFEFIKDSLSITSLSDLFIENEIELVSTTNDYVKFLWEFYEIVLTERERNILRTIEIGMDFSSGVSSIAFLPFIELSRLNILPLNEKLNGSFPMHSPDPSKAKEFLKEELLDKKLFFTAVFDGDGDRLLFFDENAEPILFDHIIAKYIDYFSNRQSCFVCDLRVSRVISDICKEKDMKLNLIRVGRAFYKDFMDKNSCIFGAELSGHLFFRDFHNFDNPDVAFIYMLKFVAMKLLKNPNTNFSDIFKKYETYHKIPETNLEVNDSGKVLEKLKEEYKDNITLEIDGLSFDFKDYWFNIRNSNTEQLIRINFEGFEKEKTQKEMRKLTKFIQNI